MTDDDERREAEQLADDEYRKIAILRKVHTWSEGFVEGYAAGRDSMRAERDHWGSKYGRYVDKWNDADRLRNQRDTELLAERERSAKLIEALRVAVEYLTEVSEWMNPSEDAWVKKPDIWSASQAAEEALIKIAEYEAGK